jgi:hypothetical protein
MTNKGWWAKLKDKNTRWDFFKKILGTKIILIITLNDKSKTKIKKSKIQQKIE